jgi:hypothetical protein
MTDSQQSRKLFLVNWELDSISKSIKDPVKAKCVARNFLEASFPASFVQSADNKQPEKHIS